jgi:serine/threonine protein kinase/Tfp pilus assembly protein PilF
VPCRECGHDLLPLIESQISRTEKLNLNDAVNPRPTLRNKPIAPKVGKKYRLERIIGHGGMGAIYAVFENDIHRNVAMKVMLEDSGHSEHARFIQEAQITGQLEHPNIVPVHELGTDSEGRPYFTMKMVRGRSLAALLASLKRRDSANPAEYSQSRLLAILVSVCNATAFAHSKGIIHRDLKPSNIMLGNFGEVMVMDWGLAKTLGTPGDAQAKKQSAVPVNASVQMPDAEAAVDAEMSSIVWNYRNESGAGTVQGTVTGTPVYMSPEQARGEISNIDIRSDIYALGAILYEIVTLSPPVHGKTVKEILANAGKGQIDRPELTAPGRPIPKELSAIAMKALAFDKSARYQSAEDLRNDIERFLQGGSVSAREDNFLESVVKLVKRNKPVFVTSLVAALVILTVAGIGLQQVLEKKGDAEAQLRKRLEIEKDVSEHQERTFKEASKALNDAKTALTSARIGPSDSCGRSLIEAESKFRRALFLFRVNPDASAGLRDASLDHFELALKNRNWQQALEKLDQARECGLDDSAYNSRVVRLEAAENDRSNMIKTRIKALFDDAQKTIREIPHNQAERELISLRDPITVELLLPYLSHLNPLCRQLAIDGLAWMYDAEVAKDILPNIESGFRENENPLQVQECALRAICNLASADEAIFLSVRRRLFADPYANESLLYRKLEPHYVRYAAFMANRLADKINANGTAPLKQWFELGLRYNEARLFQESIRCFDKVLEIDNRNHAAYFYRAGQRAAIGELNGAIIDLDKAIEIDATASALWNRGKFKHRLKIYEGALEDLNQAIEKDLHNPHVYVERGEVKRELGDVKAAIEDFTQALSIDPSNVGALNRRTWAWRADGNLPSALDDAERRISLEPDNAKAYQARAVIRRDMKNLDGAEEDYKKAITLDPKLQSGFRWLGDLMREKARFEEAIANYKIASTLDPNDLASLYGSAEAKFKFHDYHGALADINKAIERDPITDKYRSLRSAILEAKANSAVVTEPK